MRSRHISLLSIGIAVALGAPPTAAGQGPGEPNDSILSATGPLLGGGTYSAALETPTDRDFFYFYVTSAGGGRVELRIKNLGGGPDTSDIDVTVMDDSATPFQSVSYIRNGEERTLSVELPPQKYFAEIRPGEGFGDGYSLTPAGTTGAFGPYSQVAKACSSASAHTQRSERKLKRAKERLLRATALLRRSRYAPAAARRAARNAVHEERVMVTARRRALERAEGTKDPWCSISS